MTEVELFSMLLLIEHAFAAVGALFMAMLASGLSINGLECAIALDQFVGTCVIRGHMADETISAWAHRRQHKRTEALINWLFRDPNHCAKAYLSEMNHTQEPEEYRG